MTASEPFLIDAAGRQFVIAKPQICLGRSPRCDIFIADQRASRRHALVSWDGEGCTLSDLDSANGTFLNGRRITTPNELRDGDKIAIASAVFTFRDPQATLREAEFPTLVVDEASGELWVNRAPVTLSPKERALFNLFYQNANQPCSKLQIAQAVWPEYQAEVSDYQVESLVKRLREKLETDPRNPVLVITVRGWGYKLVTGG